MKAFQGFYTVIESDPVYHPSVLLNLQNLIKKVSRPSVHISPSTQPNPRRLIHFFSVCGCTKMRPAVKGLIGPTVCATSIKFHERKMYSSASNAEILSMGYIPWTDASLPESAINWCTDQPIHCARCRAEHDAGYPHDNFEVEHYG